MKKTFGILTGLFITINLVGCASSAPVEEVPYVSQKVDLATEMRTISASLQAFNQASDATSAKTALKQLRTAVERSQYVVPNTIAVSDTAKVSAYMGDLTAMLNIIDQANTLVDAAKLAEAKNLIKQLDPIKDKAHQAYR